LSGEPGTGHFAEKLFADNCHLKERGYEILAEEVFKKIVSESLVKK